MKKTDGKHTAGPWMAKGLYIEGENRVIARSVLLAKSNLGGEEAENELGKANARLIAAAPDLLAALELAQATIERLTAGYPAKVASTQGTIQVAQAAISKARG